MTKVLGAATLPGGLGAQSVNVGILPTSCKISVGEKIGGDTIDHKSEGIVVGSTQKVISNYSDGVDSNTKNDNKVIKHYEKIGGVWTLVFEANWVSFTGTHINLNVTNANASTQYQLIIEAEN